MLATPDVAPNLSPTRVGGLGSPIGKEYDVRMAPAAQAPEIKVELTELPGALVERAKGFDTGIVMLPLDDTREKAVYSEPSVMLVKELRSLGADAEFADPPEGRVFEVKKGAEIAVAVAIGIGATASWDVMKLLLLRFRRQRLSVTYLELEPGSDKHGKAWRVEGAPEGVVKAIDALREGLG